VYTTGNFWAEFGAIATDVTAPSYNILSLAGTNPKLRLQGTGSELPAYDGTADSVSGVTNLTHNGAVVESLNDTREILRFRATGTGNAGSGGVAFGNTDADDILIHRLDPAKGLRFDLFTYIAGASNDTLLTLMLLGLDGKQTLPAGDSTGAPGSATINAPSGRFAVAALASSATITNSSVSASSVVLCVIQTADASLTSIKSVTIGGGGGSFTFNGNAAATGTTVVGFMVLN
jgi:hypothetical protein